MPERKVKRALISVYDKTGIVDFARALVEEFGIEIISTGGTASLLKENDIPVTLVEDVTGFPEMMDGRVKTLHPKIHAGILAIRDDPEHMRQLKQQGIEPIDMVVVSLYPFEETVRKPDCTFEQAIEMIDIGGPSMLRAAAKNHQHVVVISVRAQLDIVLARMREHEGIVDENTRLDLAHEVFDNTSDYDLEIHSYLAHHAAQKGQEPEFGMRMQRLRLPIRRLHSLLRYGENPHQSAAAYKTDVSSPYTGVSAVTKKASGDVEVSFNNFVDADAALALCRELAIGIAGASGGGGHTCVFVKHTNACGAGVAADPITAYRRAYAGDPNAAMGGILACNFQVTSDFADAVMDTYGRWGKELGAGGFFVEVWLAPGFDDDAIEVIRTRKKWGERVRLLPVGDIAREIDSGEMWVKKIAGGMLLQDQDTIGLNEDQWQVVTKRRPTDPEMSDLRLAWLICKHTKSNAITVCKDNMLIGNGAGQMSRVMSCRIATWLAAENGHEGMLKGAAAASDAFFPFRDGPDILMDSGVTAIIQPGGSKRDADTIAACDERDVAMVFTGTRHFRH
jgi:phosphoribosylaminoimidazolecarboxamide formyltransferase/IMP cyclohydrolase